MEQAVYTAYGDTARGALRRRTAYTGEPWEAGTKGYLLNGRLYDPQLRRFHKVDPRSPFDDGGVNRYAYCSGDSINRIDPSGNTWQSWVALARRRHVVDGGGRPPRQTSAATAERMQASSPGAAAVVAAGRPKHVTAPVRSLDGAAARAASEGNRHRPALNNPMPAEAGPYGAIVVKNDPEGRDLFQRADLQTFEIVAEWHSRPLRLDNGGMARHWLADSAINLDHTVRPLRKIVGSGDVRSPGPIYVYAGVHGAPNGENWAEGLRQAPAPFTPRDADDIRTDARSAGLRGRITLENIANISESSMEAMMRREGEHVHAYCYSAVDRLVLRVLNVPPVPVYVFP